VTRAVLWDFDGTLAYREGRWSQALLDALDRACPGHGASRDALRPGLRDGFPWHRPDVGHAHPTADAWWAALAPVLAGACTAAGVGADDAQRAAAALREVYLDPAGWRVYDDVRPAFGMLGGYRHVVVSNHVPELPSLVAALGLPVDAVVTSATVGWEKPHPRVWEAALVAAGSPREVWMVGDNPEADVCGAEAAGIPAILVRTADPGVARACGDLLAAAALILG
jgi:putative hydrolase of the HAD superfamily